MKIDIVLINGTSVKAGKDTTAVLITKSFYQAIASSGEIKCSVQLMTRFAYKLKQIAEILTGMKMVQYSKPWYTTYYYDFTQGQKDTYLPQWDMTLGRLLQLLATEAIRDNFDKDDWVKTTADHIYETIFELTESTHPMISNSLITIPDWRFPNEGKVQTYLEEYLRRKAFIDKYPFTDINLHYIKVGRKVDESELQGKDMSHSSENSLNSFKATMIDNNGTLEELEEECKKFVQSTILK